MRRPLQIAVLAGVAAAVPASPLLLAQAQQKAEVKGTATATVEVKVGDVKRVDAGGKAVEKQVVIKKAVKPPPAAPAGAANVDPQVRQYVQQFRPAMRAEYYFLRAVCAPTAEQRKLIAREGEKAVRDAAKSFADAQRRPAQFVNGRWVYPDPRKMIEDAMAKAIAPHLKPEQAEKFKAEVEARAKDRREAVVRNVVAKIDQDLVLSAEQRGKIAAAALAKWQDSWCQSLETLLYGDQFYPRLPDDVVVPHLDDKQKALWRGQQQNQSFFFGFVGNMLPMQEDPEEDKELIAAREEADRDQPPNNNAGVQIRRVIAPAAGVVEMKVVAPAAKAAPAAKK